MTIKQTLAKVGNKVSKHSPFIFTTLGVVGLGATAYLAYRSRHKVEDIVNDIEECRANDEEINKLQVAKDLAEALYIPIAVGAASMVCILMSYKIQNNRIASLVTALAAQQAHGLYLENKFKKKYGQEEYNKFMTPTDEVEMEVEGKNGKTKLVVQEVKKEIDQTIGQWYDESSEYASDDHSYNIAMIDSVNDRLCTILFQRGSLLLNEVREALGFQRTRAGALLGWSIQDGFNIEKVVTTLGDVEMGELKEQIWVTWTRPSYIYDTVEFNGRYSIHG